MSNNSSQEFRESLRKRYLDFTNDLHRVDWVLFVGPNSIQGGAGINYPAQRNIIYLDKMKRQIAQEQQQQGQRQEVFASLHREKVEQQLLEAREIERLAQLNSGLTNEEVSRQLPKQITMLESILALFGTRRVLLAHKS